MDKQYYKDYFSFERNHWWFKARKEILRKYIQQHIYRGEALDVINIGAATGASSEMLSNFGRLTSIEYDQDCIDYVQDKIALPIIKGDVLNLDFPNDSFDLVCAFDVIEHVEDDERALREMLRICRPGGHILLTVPALMSLWSEHDEINHHFRRYRSFEIEKLFTTLGNTREVLLSYYNARLFPLIYTARKISNIFSSKSKNDHHKSDFEKFKTGFLNGIFYRILEGESKALLKLKKYRIGVSIIGHFVKRS